MSEVVIGKAAAAWLASLGFEVYQEVQIGQGSRTIDLVGVMDPLLVTVECKTRFGVDVIEQAEHWTRFAHYSWVAVPEYRRQNGQRFAERVCRAFGVGVLAVDNDLAIERVHAEYRRRAPTSTIRGYLLEGQKTALPAGSQGGGRYTPFRQTCDALARIVRESPGLSMREAVDQIDHHYSAPHVARASLLRWLQAGKIPKVRIERDGRAIRLFPDPMPKA